MNSDRIAQFSGIFEHLGDIIRTCLRYCWIKLETYDSWRHYRFASVDRPAPTKRSPVADPELLPSDDELVEKIHQLVQEKGMSALGATTALSPQIRGSGTRESKIKRIQRAYSAKYGKPKIPKNSAKTP
jgi:hypothetical protein